MTRDDVIRLARESGNPDAFAIDHGHHLFSLVELERFAALVRAQVLLEMKSDSGHSATADAGASTAPLPEGEPAAWMLEYSDPYTGERFQEPYRHRPKDYEMAAGDTVRPLVYGDEGREWPAGLIDRVKAAAKRIDDNRAPRSIPADPHSDVDLVLAEVRCFLEGSAPPFWMKDAPRCRSADTARHGSNEQAESASPSVLLIRGEK